jgi:L-ascorbate metabolism protein UlaG (beta-lactamase superfamily)
MPMIYRLIVLALWPLALSSYGQEGARLDSVQLSTNRDVTVRMANVNSPYVTLERSTNIGSWESLVTLKSTDPYSDTGAPYRDRGYYRAIEISGTNVLTGDHLVTTNGNLTFHPVYHASLVMNWNGLTIYNDPAPAQSGGSSVYTNFPKADLILISHEHGDHYDPATLRKVLRTNAPSTIIIATKTIYSSSTFSSDLKAITTVMTNGMSTNVLGIQIDAVPAYNPSGSPHAKGVGNGYVLGIGGRRVYFAGDTGALAEMKSLPQLDVAFVCMNVPYTMTVTQASTVVKEFAPRVVYPYHYKNQDNTFTDLNLFRRQVGTDQQIEVRARKWY